MSEPIRTSPAKRAKLASALKRNMARRKGVGSHQSPVASEASTDLSGGPRVALRASREAAGVSSFSCEGGASPPSVKSTS